MAQRTTILLAAMTTGLLACAAEEDAAPPLTSTGQSIVYTLAQNVYTNSANLGGDPFYTGAATAFVPTTPGPLLPQVMSVSPYQATQWRARTPILLGTADLHNHMFAEHAFGGGWFHGHAVGNEATAMASCDHGASIIKNFSFKGDKHFRKDVIAFSGANANCALGLLKPSSSNHARLNRFLNCLDKNTPFAADRLAMHFMAQTHGALKLPLYLLEGDMWDDDGNHSANLGGFENGYSGWPSSGGGVHQQSWEGFLRQAHEQIPFAHYLKAHVYQVTGSEPSTVVSTDPNTHRPLLRPDFVSAWTTKITNNAAWPKQKAYTGATMTTFINDNHLILAKLDFQGTNYATYMAEAAAAGKAGLNLMVMSAVDFKPLCNLVPNFTGDQNMAFNNHTIHVQSAIGYADAGWSSTQSRCGDLDINKQLSDAQAFATANASWVTLARSPAEARTAISQGKLAMILSVENTDLFADATDSSQIAGKVQALATSGVTTLQLTHEFDSPLSGAAINNPVFAGFYVLRKLYAAVGYNFENEMWKVHGPIGFIQSVMGKLGKVPACSRFNSIGSFLDYLHLDAHRSGAKVEVSVDFDETVLKSDAMACLTAILTTRELAPPLCKIAGGSASPVGCIGGGNNAMASGATVVGGVQKQNERTVGLLPFGRAAVDEMVLQGMPIDTAHMSAQAVRDLDRYLNQKNYCLYPVYVSHGHPQGAKLPSSTDDPNTAVVEGWEHSEYDTIDDVLYIVRARGGIYGIRPARDTSREVIAGYPGGAGPRTDWSFYQTMAYLWTYGVNVAFGSDFNGWAAMARGRCNQSSDPGCGVNALNTDFDWKGLAHVGYLADLTRDLIELDFDFFGGFLRKWSLDLNYSAENYLRMWERAQLLRSAPAWRANGWSCLEIEERMLTATGVTMLNGPRPASPTMPSVTAPLYSQPNLRLTGFDNVGVPVAYPKLGSNSRASMDMPVLAALDFVLPRTLNTSTIANSDYVHNMITVLDGQLVANYVNIFQKSSITVPTTCTNSVYGGSCTLVQSALTQYNLGQLDQNIYWTTWANLVWRGTWGAFGRMDDPVTSRPGSATPITWTNLSYAAVDGSGLDSTSPVDDWISGAFSVGSIASTGGAVEFVANEVSSRRMIGLSHADGGAHYGTIDFALYLNINQVLIFERGVQKAIPATPFVVGDVFQVKASGNQVTYWKNGVLLYTSLTAPTYPLYVDVAFYTGGMSPATVTGMSLFNFNDGIAAQSDWMGCCAQQCETQLSACGQNAACAMCLANDPAATGCSSNSTYQAIGACLDVCRETPIASGGCGASIVECTSNSSAASDPVSGLDNVAGSGCPAYGGICNFNMVCDPGENATGCPYDCAPITTGTYAAPSNSTFNGADTLTIQNYQTITLTSGTTATLSGTFGGNTYAHTYANISSGCSGFVASGTNNVSWTVTATKGKTCSFLVSALGTSRTVAFYIP